VGQGFIGRSRATNGQTESQMFQLRVLDRWRRRRRRVRRMRPVTGHNRWAAGRAIARRPIWSSKVIPAASKAEPQRPPGS